MEVLRARLRPPPHPPISLLRPQLLQRLTAAADTRQLILLATPAGYSKTTLLADYYANLSYPPPGSRLNQLTTLPLCRSTP